MRSPLGAAIVAAALAAPATAAAHVTVQPTQAPEGAFTVLEVRVPNERDNASTTKVVLRMPPGFVSASYEPVPGWRVKVATAHLAQPIQTPDGPIHEVVGTITWTASGKDGGIRPGQFRDFPISVQIPGKAGDTLTFKALQTYSNGEVVRWIGSPDSDLPAARLAVTQPTGDAAATSDGDGGSDGLAIAALVVGALGLLAGGAALLSARRRPI
jgi:uncharacterized protein YcnI